MVVLATSADYSLLFIGNHIFYPQQNHPKFYFFIFHFFLFQGGTFTLRHSKTNTTIINFAIFDMLQREFVLEPGAEEQGLSQVIPPSLPFLSFSSLLFSSLLFSLLFLSPFPSPPSFLLFLPKKILNYNFVFFLLPLPFTLGRYPSYCHVW